MKKFFLLLLCSISLLACKKDPIFNSEEVRVESMVYIDSVSFRSANVYCQIATNVTINMIVLQYSLNPNMKAANEVTMNKTGESPEEAEFEKKSTVFLGSLKDLRDDTTYYCAILIETPAGTSTIKDNLTFTTKSLSTFAVITKAATDISLTSATLNGFAIRDNSISIGKRGFYYATKIDLSDKTILNAGSGSGEFNSPVSNLTPNVTYYYSAFVIIDGEEYTGSVESFVTTSYTKAQVTTGNVSEINYTSATCDMLILDNGNSRIKEAGIMYSTSHDFDTETGTKVPYSTSGSYSYNNNTTYKVTLKNLEKGNTYYYCAYAINNAGIALGEIKSFSTKSEGDLIVLTGEYSSLSYRSVDLYYSLEAHGQHVLEHGIIYDTEDNNGLAYDDGRCLKKKSTSNAGDMTDWTINNTKIYVSSLTHGTKYIYKAYVKFKIKNSQGEDEDKIYYGEEKNFETLNYKIPTVTTVDATNIQSTTAKISLTSSSNGTSITDNGFYISSDYSAMAYSDPEDFENNSNIWTKKSIGKYGTSTTLTNLEGNTTYYYVAYATNEVGTGYGIVKNFTTKDYSKPTVTTSSVTNRTYTSFIGGGNVTDDGGTEVTERGVCYSTTSLPTINDNKVASGSGTGKFSCNIAGLTAGTKYYIRAYATNAKGTSYGDEVTTTTLSSEGEITINETNLTGTWISISTGGDVFYWVLKSGGTAYYIQDHTSYYKTYEKFIGTWTFGGSSFTFNQTKFYYYEDGSLNDSGSLVDIETVDIISFKSNSFTDGNGNTWTKATLPDYIK